MTSGKYFNRAVIALDAPHIGYVVRETDDKIVVFGEGKQRYDIPLSEIKTVSKNVLVGLKFEEIANKYSVKRMHHFLPVNMWTLGEKMILLTLPDMRKNMQRRSSIKGSG